jgi:hypothetical protein
VYLYKKIQRRKNTGNKPDYKEKKRYKKKKEHNTQKEKRRKA